MAVHRQHHQHKAVHHHPVHRHHIVHRRRQRLWQFLLLVVAIILIADFLVIWARIKPAPAINLPPETPLVEPTTTAQPTATPTESPTVPTGIPTQINLAVPFTPQAPTGNWDKEHEEFCEEASLLMVERFFAEKTIDGSSDAEAGLQEINSWEQDHGFLTVDLTIAQVAEILKARDGLTTQIITNPTTDDMKQALANKHLVVVPAAGRELNNPYFTAPGPVYHMFVLKGYTTNDNFITNDPGTKHGANYVYSSATILNAMGDFNNDHPETGAKVVLVVYKA